MAEIFISYRRNDDRAERIYRYLEEHLYPGAVFQDVHGGNLEEFRRSIEGKVRDARLVLVVLGEVFFNRMDELACPDDCLAMELRTALVSGKPVLPVIVTNRAAAEFRWPGEFASLDQATRHYVSVWPQSQRPEDINTELPRLLKEVKPHLTEYWRRRSRRLAVAAGLMGLVLLGIMTGLIFVAAAGKRIVLEDTRRDPLPNDFALRVDRDTDHFTGKAPPSRQAPPPARDDWKLRTWLGDYVDWLNKTYPKLTDVRDSPKDKYRVYVLTAPADAKGDAKEPFDRNYTSGCMRLSHTVPGFAVRRSTCFLVGQTKEGPGVPRPVYRQLKVFLEATDTCEPEGHLAIELTHPNKGERLLLFIVLERNQEAAVPWPEADAGLNFKLEKSS